MVDIVLTEHPNIFDQGSKYPQCQRKSDKEKNSAIRTIKILYRKSRDDQTRGNGQNNELAGSSNDLENVRNSHVARSPISRPHMLIDRSVLFKFSKHDLQHSLLFPPKTDMAIMILANP